MKIILCYNFFNCESVLAFPAANVWAAVVKRIEYMRQESVQRDMFGIRTIKISFFFTLMLDIKHTVKTAS